MSPKEDDNSYAKKSWWQFPTLLDSSRNNPNDADDFPSFLPVPKDHVPFRGTFHQSNHVFSSDREDRDDHQNDNVDEIHNEENDASPNIISKVTLPYKHRHSHKKCPLFEEFEIKRVCVIPQELYLPSL